MVFKIVVLFIIAFLLLIDYAMLVVASRAEERANRMYKLWKESQNERSRQISDR